MGTISNEQKAKNITKGFLKEGLIKKSRIQELLTKAMDWKDKQFAIEKQQWIEKATQSYCENCDNTDCQLTECIDLQCFKEKLLKKIQL